MQSAIVSSQIDHLPEVLTAEVQVPAPEGERSAAPYQVQVGVRLLKFEHQRPADHSGGVVPYLKIGGRTLAAWLSEPEAVDRGEPVASVGGLDLRVPLDARAYRDLRAEFDRAWDTPAGQALMRLLAERDESLQDVSGRTAALKAEVVPALLTPDNFQGRSLVWVWKRPQPITSLSTRYRPLCHELGRTALLLSEQDTRPWQQTFLGWTSRNGALYELSLHDRQRLLNLNTERSSARTGPAHPDAARRGPPAPGGRYT